MSKNGLINMICNKLDRHLALGYKKPTLVKMNITTLDRINEEYQSNFYRAVDKPKFIKGIPIEIDNNIRDNIVQFNF